MFGGYAASINSKVTSLNNVLINVDGIDFEGNWKSTASQKLMVSLDNAVSKINTEKGNLQTFANAIKRIDELIEMDGKIDSLSSQLVGLDSDDEDDAVKIASIKLQISKIKLERDELKQTIKGILESFGSVGTEYSLLHSNTADFDYICDIAQLEETLKKCYVYEGGSLVNLYSDVQENGLSGMDYINSMLNSVADSYSGREAAVNSAIMAIMLAADKGYKIRYRHEYSNGANGVKYNTNEQLVKGMDCCEYVSWAVNKGTADPFHWEGVGGFAKLGDAIDISQAQPGDVLTRGNPDGSNSHVVIVVANNPETGQITVAEEAGTVAGARLVTKNYSDYRAFQARSLEDYYTGAKSNA